MGDRIIPMKVAGVTVDENTSVSKIETSLVALLAAVQSRIFNGPIAPFTHTNDNDKYTAIPEGTKLIFVTVTEDCYVQATSSSAVPANPGQRVFARTGAWIYAVGATHLHTQNAITGVNATVNGNCYQ